MVCAVAALVLVYLLASSNQIVDICFHLVGVVVDIIGPQLWSFRIEYCLRYLSSSTVALGLLLEPVGAGLLAWLLFYEVPSMMDVSGATLIALGVAIGLKDESQSK